MGGHLGSAAYPEEGPFTDPVLVTVAAGLPGSSFLGSWLFRSECGFDLSHRAVVFMTESHCFSAFSTSSFPSNACLLLGHQLLDLLDRGLLLQERIYIDIIFFLLLLLLLFLG